MTSSVTCYTQQGEHQDMTIDVMIKVKNSFSGVRGTVSLSWKENEFLWPFDFCVNQTVVYKL